MEQLNMSETVKSSRRRLSSILKAPRTSMKVVGAEPEEQQEEVTKPIEKKRISRRVSFATTNNVRVFSDNAKSESPVLASIQNTTAEYGIQDQRILHFVDEANHQIKGLETLLNNPLYVSQHLNKENFFSDPVFQDDCVDRTMLLGEDTGVMDITHSHTITIDNDYEVNDEPKPDFDLKVAQTLSGNQNVASQGGLSCSAKVVTKNVTMDSDFNAFLASISQPVVKHNLPPSSKKELGEDTGDMDITQSNTITIDKHYENDDQPNPDFALRVPQVVGGNQNVPSKTGLSFKAKIETKNSTMDSDFNAFLASVSLPIVKNIAPPSSKKELGGLFSSVNTCTSEIDKENHLPSFLMKQVQHPGGMGNPQQPRGLQRRRSRIAFLEDDDMEATTSHTVVIEKGNAQLVPSSVYENHGSIVLTPAFSNDDFSENDNAMEMTGAFDVSVQEKEHTISMNEDTPLPVPAVSKMPFNVIGNGEIMEKKQPETNQTFHSGDMEMTETLDLSVQEKEHTLRIKEEAVLTIPSESKMSSMNLIGNRSNLSIVQTDNYDDMDMTQCQTIVLETKQSSVNKPFSNLRKSLPHASESRTVREKDHTANVGKMSTFNLIENGSIMDHNKSGNLSIAQTTCCDDMEMTQCQTIVLGTECSFSNSRQSLPHASVSRTIRDTEYTVSMKEQDLLPIPRASKLSSFNMVENGEIMDHNKSGNLSIARIAGSDDMEMTQCQTIVLGTEQSSGNNPFSNSRKSLTHAPVSRMVRDTENTVRMKEEALLPIPRASKMSSFNMIKNGEILDHNKSGNISIAQIAGSDEMEMTQCQTIILETKPSRKSLPCLSVFGNEGSDGMDMTTSATDISAKKRASSSVNQTITLVEPMDITEVHMLPISEWKHKAFMTRRRSTMTEMGMMSLCDPEDTGDMEMTQCQTVVLEAKNYERGKPLSKSRKSLNVVSASSNFDAECMEMTQALTGNIMLKSLISNEKRKTERNLLPAAQRCLMQDQTDRMELTLQASASSLAMPSVDNEMELTESNTIAIDAKSTLATSATEIKAIESVLGASPSVSTCTVSSGEQNEMTEAAKNDIKQDTLPSKNIPFALKSGENLQCNTTEAMLCVPDDMQMGKNGDMAQSSNVTSMRTSLPLTMTSESSNEYNNMQDAKFLTMPIETQNNVSFNQKEVVNIETLSGTRNVEMGHVPCLRKDSVQLEVSSSTDSVADCFIKEELQHAKSRRRSLADFKMELQNISRHINVEQEVMRGSTTAPLPSCFLPEISLNDKEQCEIAGSTEQAPIATPMIKQKDNSVQNQKTTPFSLKKKPFSSRLSFCGIVPKLTKRATVTPNKTVAITTKGLQCLPLDKHFDVIEQNSNCETVNINDEEFPEMSSEEDLSGSLENWPVNKEDECNEALTVPTHEEPFQDDVFEANTSTSQRLKRPYTEEGYVTAEQTKKAYISDMGPGCHEAAVQWEGNFTSHAAQNNKAKTIEETGVSESTFRNSQCDSHLDGTMNHEFDFNKKLEDGSITVNEFLSYFGVNFVIHRSRPSALPESCRAGETLTMEDLLKEKYMYHPKQRVYEQDCKNLTDIVERLKEQMPEQEKPLRCINGALHQETCTLSKEKLKSFGSKLKERRVYFGKRSKALSHEMKGVLYSELSKTAQDAKQSLLSKIKETDEMITELDGCINELETELAAVNAVVMGDHHNNPEYRPALKAKEEDLHNLHSAVTKKERENAELESQLKTLEGQQEKLRGETRGLKSHLATLNCLNEWRLNETDESGALFTFLHNTVHLQVKLQTPAGKEWMTEDVERNIEISFQMQLDVDKSECHASMVHKLLALHHRSQTQWLQRYPTSRHIPELLHDLSLVVGRLRLLGEEIHRLKKWGGLKLRILRINCVDTQVHIVFSSVKAFEKFELILRITPDYPFGPLEIQDFSIHVGSTRLNQIEDIISSVKPANNYLTKVLKKIYDDLLS
ncbi:uncharacterized protein knl1 isoform X2 [Myxocyprinus asiaticus]|uniref:uncharacterized protein knl1 isoform X2 n=1 Tax=Myxocyprinus asiaticus TaxID=70543 RepID=UPI0022226C4B|nr:uncharacterized protein knl1 isoform X2 [Myxocyprinus asiaticus]